VIRRRVGGLGGDDLTTPVKRVVGASAVMAVATVLALNVSGANSGFGLLARVVLAVVVGVLAYVATAGFLASRHARRTANDRARRSGTRPGATLPPSPVGRRSAPGRSSPEPFRGRLRDDSVDPPYRHLRPVGRGPEGDAAPGQVDRPGHEEEDSDGPDTGGNR
jgi:hypothetical protein